jgi:hypothetical protein
MLSAWPILLALGIVAVAPVVAPPTSSRNVPLTPTVTASLVYPLSLVSSGRDSSLLSRQRQLTLPTGRSLRTHTRVCGATTSPRTAVP